MYPSYVFDQFEYVNARTKGAIFCPVEGHGVFWQFTCTLLQGHGCPKCGRKRGALASRNLPEDFFTAAKEKFGGKYDYCDFIFVNTSTRGTIHCPIPGHGTFRQTPDGHLRQGYGCPECGRVAKLIFKTKAEFVARANIVHGGRFTYENFDYEGVEKPSWITCPLPGHGDFKQAPNRHLKGNNCPECDRVRRTQTPEEFKDKATRRFGGKYGYDECDYVKSWIKVRIFCPESDHGYFEKRPNDHLNGQGCPRCKSSRGQVAVRACLESLRTWFQSLGVHFHYEEEITFDGLRDKQPLFYDFIVTVGNQVYAIEFNGKQHYEPVRWSNSMSEEDINNNFIGQQHRDKLKRDWWWDSHHRRLLEIRYDEIDVVNDLIYEHLGLGKTLSLAA